MHTQFVKNLSISNFSLFKQLYITIQFSVSTVQSQKQFNLKQFSLA